MAGIGKLQATEVVILVVGGLTDGPGFKLVSDGHGGFKVVPIPGWEPEVMRELGAALRALTAGAHIKSAEGASIVNLASKIVQAKVQHQLGHAAAGHVETTVFAMP
jgi:hypothetical protein